MWILIFAIVLFIFLGTVLSRIKILEHRIDAIEASLREEEETGTERLEADAEKEMIGAAIGMPVQKFEHSPDLPEEASGELSDRDESADLPISNMLNMSVLDTFVKLVSFLARGSAVVHVGLVVLLFGFAFLIRRSGADNIFTIEMAVCAVMVLALAMLGIGWFLVRRRKAYALLLQGGSVAVLYTCLFLAGEIYALFPVVYSLCAMTLLALLSGLLAATQNSRQIAVIGMSGGFLAPLLSPVAGANLCFLWGYYLVLVSGILALAWKRSWSELNALGFFLLALVGFMWGSYDYMFSLFRQTEPFLAIFFLYYHAVSAAYALKNPNFENKRENLVIIFGAPVCFFAFQAIIARHIPHALSVSCAALCVLYTCTALAASRVHGVRPCVSTSVFWGFALVFGNIAAAKTLGFFGTVFFFSAEASALILAGARKRNQTLCLFGAVFHALTVPVLFRHVETALFVSFSSLFSGFLVFRAIPLFKGEKYLHWALTIFGVLLWVGIGFAAIDRYVHPSWTYSAFLLFFAFLAVVLFAMSRILWWPVPSALLSAFGHCLTLFAIFLFLACHTRLIWTVPASFSYGGFPAWPPALVCLYAILRFREEYSAPGVRDILHLNALLLTVFLTAYFVYIATESFAPAGSVWPLANTGTVVGLLAGFLVLFGRKIGWPWPRIFPFTKVRGFCRLFWRHGYGSYGDARPQAIRVLFPGSPWRIPWRFHRLHASWPCMHGSNESEPAGTS